MHEDASGNIWVGYFNSPVFGGNALKITPDGILIPVDFSEGLPNNAPNNKTLSIDEDLNGTLYFSTRGGGLAINTAGEQELFWNSPCTTSLYDSEGNIWIGEGGYWSPGHKLYKKDATGEVTKYEIPGLSVAFKYQIVEDANNNIWFATDNGLYKRSPEDEFTRYTTADGLADDDITGIEIDQNGGMWIATNNGVSSTADFPSALIITEFADEKLLIYPNPSESIFNIKLSEFNGDTIDIIAFNSLGQRVYQMAVRNTQEAISLNLKDQPVGIYFIHVEMGGKSFIAKVSKL